MATLSNWFSQHRHPLPSASMTNQKILHKSCVNTKNPFVPPTHRYHSYPGRLCPHRLIQLSLEFLSGPEDLLRVAFAVTFIPSLAPSFHTLVSLFSFFSPFVPSYPLGKGSLWNRIPWCKCGVFKCVNIVGRGSSSLQRCLHWHLGLSNK